MAVPREAPQEKKAFYVPRKNALHTRGFLRGGPEQTAIELFGARTGTDYQSSRLQ